MGEGLLRATQVPAAIVEPNSLRRNEFLECPASCEPLALAETVLEAFVDGEVGEVCVTRLSIFVPPKHGVDRLCQFAAAGLINATGVNPAVSKAIVARQFADFPHFADAVCLARSEQPHFRILRLASSASQVWERMA